MQPKRTSKEDNNEDTVPTSTTFTLLPTAPVQDAMLPAALVPGTMPPATPPTTSELIPPPVAMQPIILPPAQPHPQSHPSSTTGNIWLAATNLVTGNDGRLQQSRQSPELSKYLSKTTQLANLQIFFTDAFPNLEKQRDWLAQSLVEVLQEQAKTDQVAYKVDLRA